MSKDPRRNSKKPRQSSSKERSSKPRFEQNDSPKTRRRLSLKVFGNYTLISCLILSAVIISFAYRTYNSYIEKKRLEMDLVAYEIEMNLDNTFGYAESLLNYINYRIISSKADNKKIAEILASFDESNQGFNTIKNMLSAGMFYWIDAKNQLVASSAGNLVAPVDMSNRDYLANTQKNPWKIYIGKPVIGAISGLDVIPAAVGAVDAGNNYTGTSVVSFKICDLLDRLGKMAHNYKTDFAIIDLEGKIVMESKVGVASDAKKDGYILSRNIAKYPYKILVSYDKTRMRNEIFFELLPSLIELLTIVALFTALKAALKN
jgi:hypothetical protein